MHFAGERARNIFLSAGLLRPESILGLGRELFSSTCGIELDSSLVLPFWSSSYPELVLGSDRESFSLMDGRELAV